MKPITRNYEDKIKNLDTYKKKNGNFSTTKPSAFIIFKTTNRRGELPQIDKRIFMKTPQQPLTVKVDYISPKIRTKNKDGCPLSYLIFTGEILTKKYFYFNKIIK